MERNMFKEIKDELTKDILPYWQQFAKDKDNGGFYGAISNANKGNPKEWRGIVMVSRFLWTYSAAARLLKKESYLKMADYAHKYMMKAFYDWQYGGMFWSVTPEGTPLVARKQIYGDAFSIYALSEYAAAVKEIRKDTLAAETAMEQALSVFDKLEKFAYDEVYGGYMEALSRDWQPTEDTKLSDKDIDCAKSMNTNLHVMEAYTNLYRTLPVVFPEKKPERRAVGRALQNLVEVHLHKILANGYHLTLYFDKNWKPTGPREISYGHDIEASWLLWEAACELKNLELKKEVKPVAIKIAELSLLEGFDPETGGFENTMDENGVKDSTRIWWNQAEALNGFYNAWQMTGDEEFRTATEKVWNWIMTSQKNTENGEWWWAVSATGKPAKREVKGGNWKTSYHNARCCMELLRRNGEEL
ncbi:MAG: AGE family epimerase/isomerase [Treponema sp.]|nr:AGE family epimerase/isomerase [Treponema sp.]MBO6219399.1 AGE family epimerase/isomerase [Treponema sp.]